jgi:hypothetical protein
MYYNENLQVETKERFSDFFRHARILGFEVARVLGSKVAGPAFATLFQILRKPRFRIHCNEQLAMKRINEYKI